VSVAISDLAGDYAAIIVTGSNARLAETEIAAAARELSSSAILVLQNEVPEGANLVAARMARDCGARVIINAAPAREMSPELLDLVDVLIVNAVEAEMLGGGVVVDLASAAVAAERLGARVPAVIVTAGGHGLALRSGVGSATIGAHPVSLISTHGAGDAFVGALAAQLSRGAALETAAVYANAAAAVLVATPETERQNLTHEATHALLQRA
jgi:ribokinase